MKRAPYSKSRTGCGTCRIRHVKCDEATPNCLKCTSTGRSCDGPRMRNIIIYKPGETRQQHIGPLSVSLEISPLSWLDTPEEHRSFTFFQTLVAPILSGVFDVPCWSTLVPQFARTSLVVRYGMFAVATFFEEPLRAVNRRGDVIIHPISGRHSKGLKWHSKAFFAAKSASQVSLAELLMRSLVFATLEFQQNNFDAGLKLLQIMVRLSAPLMTAGHDDAETKRAPECDDVVSIVLPMAMRSLCFVASSLSEDCVYITLADAPIKPTSLIDIHALQVAVQDIQRNVYAFLKDAYFAIELNSIHQLERLLEVRIRLIRQAQTLRENIRKHPDTTNQRVCLVDYCNVYLAWLDLLRILFDSPAVSSQIYLQRIFAHTQHLIANSKTLFPAASSTKYFYLMTITPAAYLVALLLQPGPMREQSLRQIHLQPLAHGTKAQLHAIVLSTGDLEFSTTSLQYHNIFRICNGQTDRLWVMTKICDFTPESPQQGIIDD